VCAAIDTIDIGIMIGDQRCHAAGAASAPITVNTRHRHATQAGVGQK
jgi:hypothetical protein